MSTELIRLVRTTETLTFSWSESMSITTKLLEANMFPGLCSLTWSPAQWTPFVLDLSDKSFVQTILFSVSSLFHCSRKKPLRFPLFPLITVTVRSYLNSISFLCYFSFQGKAEQVTTGLRDITLRVQNL